MGRWLNRRIRKKNFRIETVKSIDFLALVDLQEAYLQILIQESHRKILHFHMEDST